MSLVVRKPVFSNCENKDADQLRSNCENKDADQLRSNCAADQRLGFHYKDKYNPSTF